MKKRMFPVLFIAAATVSCSLTACSLFDGGGEYDDDIKVTYHLNGGYRGDDPTNTADYRHVTPSYNLHSYKTINAKKDTWYLEGWYFDEQLTEKFSDAQFVELYNMNADIDLYANWIDRIVVTKDNFTEFFKVTSRWNGGLNAGGNAAINYSFEPVMAYDPELSAESIELSVTPYIGSWSNGSNTVCLESADDYYYYGQKRIDGSAAGTQFQIGSSTLSWTLVTESFELQLLHRDPIAVHLDLDGGECEKTALEVEGGHKLLKSELPTPKKSGYRFMGWYADAEYETEYEERQVTRERTFYAKFTKEVKVTFYPNGGSKDDDGLELLTGDFINTYTPEKADHKFLGWYTDAEFENRLELGARAADADLDLYAKWAKIHTVSFETNGGTFVINGLDADKTLRVVDGEKPDIARVTTTKGGLAFIGWYTDPECEHKYEVGPTTGDLTLYALWAREISFANPTVEDLKQYVNFEITEEYTTVTEKSFIYNVRMFTITASVKEEYIRLGLHIYGQIEIQFTTENNQNGGNGYFDKFTISTLSDAPTYVGTYYTKSGYVSYDETTSWQLRLHLSGRVYLPEDGDSDVL